MKTICISIIIPVYNAEKWLGSCLDSIIAQDLENIEIICVDDSSTDSSPEILSDYAKKDPRIRILSHESNQGSLIARKNGVLSANGEYIMFADADDTMDPGLCSCVYDLIREHNTDIFEFNVRKINTEKKTENYWNPVEPAPDNENILCWLFSRKNFRWNVYLNIYRTSLCKRACSEIPDIRCTVGQDALITFFIAYFAKSFSSLHTESMYNYYYGHGISSQMNMPVEKFKYYCEMNCIPKIISEFLYRENSNECTYKALKVLTIRLISDCCLNFQNVPEADKAAAMDIFIEHWGTFRELPEGMMYRCQQLAEAKDSEIRKNNKQHRNVINVLNSQHDTEINTLKQAHEHEINLLSNKHKTEINSQKPEIDAGNIKHEIEIKKLGEKISSLQSKIKKMNKKYETEINKKNKQLEQQKEVIELIYHSESYRIGNWLIHPFHAIKDFTNKIG